MGVLTLQQMENELGYALDARAQTQASGGQGDLTLTQLDRWLNWAYLHVMQPEIYRHRELQASTTYTLADGVFQLPMPGNLFGIYDLVNQTTSYKIWPRDWRWMQENRRITGRPAFYAPFALTINLFPTPGPSDAGNVLMLDYWKRPPALADTGAASILANEWDEIIIAGAQWRAWRQMNRPDRALEAQQDFVGLINDVSRTTMVDAEDAGFRIEVFDRTGYMRRG